MADDTPPRFRKTKTGTWAVMGPVEVLEKALAEGGKVDVQRKSGDWSTFVVASLGRPFDVDGISMCYGYGPEDDEVDGSGAGSGGGTPSVAGDRPNSSGATAPRRGSQAPRRPLPEAPAPDPTEPLPEFRGGPEDEWDGGY